MSIDPKQYEIVAVTGNSMGWYLAAAFAGALDPAAAYQVIQTMGGMMRQEIIGGQVIYPVVDDNWHSDPVKERAVEQAMATIGERRIGEIYLSIKLGGYAVIGGDKAALAEFMKLLPKAGDYPFQLLNHAAFHTPLMYETSRRAFELLPERLFNKPKIPLVDGRGVIWQPYSTDVAALYQYTLGHQVYAPYDFTSAVSVTLKEFAPDALYLLGPGSSLSGAIGQIMVSLNWRGISDKEGFKTSAKDQMILADPRK